MAIIKPKPIIERKQIRICIDANVLADIERFCIYANFKKTEEFFEEAASHILKKDKKFIEWKAKEESLSKIS